MSKDMTDLEAYAAGLLELVQDGIENGESVVVTNRRIAAIATIHAEIDPWQECLCQYCDFHRSQ